MRAMSPPLESNLKGNQKCGGWRATQHARAQVLQWATEQPNFPPLISLDFDNQLVDNAIPRLQSLMTKHEIDVVAFRDTSGYLNFGQVMWRNTPIVAHVAQMIAENTLHTWDQAALSHAIAVAEEDGHLQCATATRAAFSEYVC